MCYNTIIAENKHLSTDDKGKILVKYRKRSGFFLLPVLLFVLGSVYFVFFGQGISMEATDTREAGPASVREVCVDLNRADLSELCTLPGVGADLAQRILDYRQEHGGFKSPHELQQISGIGEKRLKQLLDYVCVEE